MRLVDRLRNKPAPERALGSVDGYTFWSNTWDSGSTGQSLESFQDFVNGGMKNNGVVFAAITARQMLLSEARFKFRNFREKETFGSPALTKLETPWPNGTTGRLISRMEQDASLAGNAYIWDQGTEFKRLRPDCVSIIVTDEGAGTVIGYLYQVPNQDEVFIPAGEMRHYMPIPDPMTLGEYKGQSWLTPVVTDILSDVAMTDHKAMFFRNAATPAMVVKHEKKFHPDTKAEIKEQLAARYEGVENAYKSLILDGGADLQIVGANMEQIDFAVTQGAGENRIAVAAGVPAVVLGIKEGLGGSSLNAGNYGEAMRRFADITCRPLWREMAATLAPSVNVPSGSELWYDASDITALKNDEVKQAGIEAQQASTIRQLVDGGFKPESVVQAVTSGDFTDLEHSGLAPVQVQPKAEGGEDETEDDQETDGQDDE